MLSHKQVGLLMATVLLSAVATLSTSEATADCQKGCYDMTANRPVFALLGEAKDGETKCVRYEDSVNQKVHCEANVLTLYDIQAGICQQQGEEETRKYTSETAECWADCDPTYRNVQSAHYFGSWVTGSLIPRYQCTGS